MVRFLLAFQGFYYIATGLWSLSSIRTFMAITGPKTDIWLVKTVGVLVIAIGAVLLRAGLRRRPPGEAALLAFGSGVGLAGIDTYYVARRRISPIYLLDAIEEVAATAALAASWRRR
jgi:hypothetical protein